MNGSPEVESNLFRQKYYMRKLVDLKYGVYEDVILFAVGIYSFILLIKHWKIKWE